MSGQVLSTKEASERLNLAGIKLTSADVAGMARNGTVANAWKEDDGRWQIPTESLTQYIEFHAKRKNRINNWIRAGSVVTILTLLLAFVSSINDGVQLLQIFTITDQSTDEVNFYIQRGSSNFNEGRIDEAIGAFQKAIELDHSNSDLYYYLGRSYALQGDYGLSLINLNEAIRLSPKSAEFHNTRGLTNSLANKPNEAMQDFDTAIRLDSGDYRFYLNKGLLPYPVISPYPPREYYVQAATDLTSAISLTLSSTLITTDGINESVHNFIDRNCHGQNLDANLDTCRRNMLISRLYYERGNASLSMRTFASAVSDYQTAIHFVEAMPGSHLVPSEYYYGLGLTHYQLGKKETEISSHFRDALDSFSKVHIYSTEESLGLYYSGLIYLHLGEPQVADEFLSRAFRSNHNIIRMVPFNLANGVVSYHLGNYEDAISAFDRSITDLQTSNLRITVTGMPLGDAFGLGVLYYNLGSAYYLSGQIDQAYEVWSHAIDIFDKFGGFRPLHINLSVMFESQGEVEKAQQEYQKALSIEEKKYLDEPILEVPILSTD